jgi:hypothetical protein
VWHEHFELNDCALRSGVTTGWQNAKGRWGPNGAASLGTENIKKSICKIQLSKNIYYVLFI